MYNLIPQNPRIHRTQGPPFLPRPRQPSLGSAKLAHISPMPKVQRAGMELCDLPDECILHAMNFMPDATVLNFAQTCKRVASLRHTDTVWLPRLWDEYGVRLRVSAAALWLQLAQKRPSQWSALSLSVAKMCQQTFEIFEYAPNTNTIGSYITRRA